MARKTEMPDRVGCLPDRPKRWFSGPPLHQWVHSYSWNGNHPGVLPFVTYKSGIARSGWRCYHCGQFVWDISDRLFALDLAEALGLIKIPQEPIL